MRLQDKIALITGAGSGLGEATAKRFAQEGALVVVTDINAGSVERVATEIVAAGGRAESRVQDVTDEALWNPLLADIVSSHGQLDVLVNNAGIALTTNVEDTTLADWRTTQEVNGESVFMGTRAAIAVMREHGGSIINISSIEGLVGEPNAAAYNYSKGGVRIFTKSAALHCAAAGYSIRINSVHPGFIATPMLEGIQSSLSKEQLKNMMERVIGEIPMGTMGEALDIANGCLFLASDESKYMTGSELVIDGGYTCH
ncbi:MAG: 3-beta hydroxysteroid dehydrogenase [Gammaproteobacteria bacterium]|nr:MAG: 3-beta hydroxysteroid dehydrogenase [Gammaproteobacteria bacterium]